MKLYLHSNASPASGASASMNEHTCIHRSGVPPTLTSLSLTFANSYNKKHQASLQPAQLLFFKDDNVASPAAKLGSGFTDFAEGMDLFLVASTAAGASPSSPSPPRSRM